MVKKEDILLLSQSLYIKISDQELDYLVKEIIAYETRINNINDVNSKDYSSMTFPFDSMSDEYRLWNYNNLRDDNEIATNTSSILKDNCENIEEGYVTLPKVI